jgi:glutamate dehydrogenase (NADP+)
MLKSKKDSLDGKVCLVSGSGNVSQYTIEKLLDFGAKPVACSDSNGVIYDPEGIDREKLAWIIEQKNMKRGRIRDYADKFRKAIFMPTDIKLDHNPLWNVKADCAFPSATQNEITAKDAANLIKNGVKLVAEGANMPSTLEATRMFLEAKIPYGPAKAANAGGVATSGLEMAQNSARLSWTREEVDDRLHKIMIAIHHTCYQTAEKYGTPGNLVNGANIGGFVKVANAMLDQGLV